ncbi:hypothetical protein L6R46_27200 [Myxococcota bacterium]|nr:hypothetical protein [Myxococcota bacterium]
MGVADEDLKVVIDYPPSGEKTFRFSLEAHLPEIGQRKLAQVAEAYRRAGSDAARENALRLGWGDVGARFWKGISRADGVFGVAPGGRARLQARFEKMLLDYGTKP